MSIRTTDRDETCDANVMLRSCVGARVRMLNRVVTRIYDEHLRSTGLKFSQMNILVWLEAKGAMPAIDVARALGFEKSTLSRNLNVLEANGWIVREPTQRRRVALGITPEGQALLAVAQPHWTAAQAAVEALLGADHAAAIHGAFQAARDNGAFA